jgi:hypothetical protein
MPIVFAGAATGDSLSLLEAAGGGIVFAGAATVGVVVFAGAATVGGVVSTDMTREIDSENLK